MNFKDLQNPNAVKSASETETKSTGIKNTINELSKLSDDQLVAELTRQLKIKKENGSLSDIEKLVRMISPFLSKEQKERLAGIVKSMQNN